MDYNCERCGYTTLVLYNLKLHFKRKKVCSPTLNNIAVSILYNDYFSNYNAHVCEYCEKAYSTIESKCNHKKKCIKKKEYDNNITEQKLEKLCVVVEDQQKKMNGQNKAIEDQQKQIEELKAKAKVQMQIQNQTNNNIKKQTNNVININAFGKEKTEYLINNPDYKKFMIDCLQKKEQGIMQMIEHIYYNDSHPENHNIKKPNKKDKFMKSYNGNKWDVIFANDGLNTILNRINKEFLLFLEAMEDNNERVKDPIMKRFMMKVGHAMNYDFSIFNYDYDCNVSDEKLKKLKNELDSLYLFYINEKTKDQLQQKIEEELEEKLKEEELKQEQLKEDLNEAAGLPEVCDTD